MVVTKSPRLGLERWSEGTDLHPNRAGWDAQQALLDDLIAIDVEVATYADRPSPKRGTYMWVVDEQRLYRATATGWMTTAKIGGGGRGTQVVIGANSSAAEGVSAFAARADHTHTLPLATSAADGAMARADKAKLDAATPDATPNTVVSRSSTGGVFFNAVALTAQPVTVNHATRKDYVDAGDSARFPFDLSAGTGSIDGFLAPGQYVQPSATPVTTANGYPFNGGAGSLLVYRFGAAESNWVIQEWTDWGSRRKFLRATNGGSANWSAWRELAGTEPATSSADGLMPRADKAMLDAATASVSASALVKRWASGAITVPSVPSGAQDATSKSYVDAAIGNAVGAIPLATPSVDGLMPKADKAAIDAATDVNTPSTFVRRNSSGRFVATGVDLSSAPTANQHATRKDYVDQAATAAANTAVGNIPLASPTLDGLMAKADKALLNTATADEVGSALVRRYSTGQVRVPLKPDNPPMAASKAYVDAGDARQVTAATNLPGAADLNTYQTDGFYIQEQNAQAATGKNYPVALAGFLTVANLGLNTFQTYQTYNGAGGNRVYVRARYDTGWSAWQELAYTTLASSTSDGLMSAADKAKLDAATSGNSGSRIALRDSGGRSRFSNPVNSLDAANKAYVDAGDAARVAAATQIPDTADLNTYQTDGFYVQTNNNWATNGANYPVPLAGLLTVANLNAMTFQTYQTYNTSGDGNKVYVRGRYNTSWGAWQEVAYTTRATSSADGLMSSGDKTLLDTATSNSTGNALVRRTPAGDVAVPSAPSSDSGATSKAYVDARVLRDTGWRDVSSLAKNLGSGATVKMRRRDDEVTMVLTGQVIIPSSRGSSYGRQSVDILDAATNIPGFNGALGGANLQPIITSDANYYLTAVSNFNRRVLGVVTDIGKAFPATGTQMYFDASITVLVKDAWPTSYPGTATTL